MLIFLQGLQERNEGFTTLAVLCIEEALRLDPSNESIKNRLEALYYQMNLEEVLDYKQFVAKVNR